jgi:hypothetical protein
VEQPGAPDPVAAAKPAQTEVSKSNPPPKVPTAKSPEEKLVELRAKFVEMKVTEEEVLAEIRTLGILDEALTLDEAVQVNPTAISTALNGIRTIVKNIEDRRAL